MSKFLRGIERNLLTFVSINPVLYYGWVNSGAEGVTGVSNADLIALGHNAAANFVDDASKIVVFSPSTPKPARYRKELNGLAGQRRSFSSFCGHSARLTALAAGFKLAEPAKAVTLRSDLRARGSKISAIAEMSNGLLYVWPMDKADFEAVKTELGLKSASEINTAAEKMRLVVAPGAGCKPGRAQKDLANGSISSFYSAGADPVQAGWSIISTEFTGIDQQSGDPTP